MSGYQTPCNNKSGGSSAEANSPKHEQIIPKNRKMKKQASNSNSSDNGSHHSKDSQVKAISKGIETKIQIN